MRGTGGRSKHYPLTMRDLFHRFVRDESAATAIEYGLVAASIALALISAVQSIGPNLSAKYAGLAGGINR